MPAVISDNRLYAQINKYYIIHVYEYKGTAEKQDSAGKIKVVNTYHPQAIVSAATLSRYVEDEKLKIKLFKEVLAAGQDVFLRLKIEFRSK